MNYSNTWLQNAWGSLDVKEMAYYSFFLRGNDWYAVADEFNTNRWEAEYVCETASDIFREEAHELIDMTRRLFLDNPLISFKAFCDKVGEKPSHSVLALIIEAGGTPSLNQLSRLDAEQVYSIDRNAVDDLYAATLAAAPISIGHFTVMSEKGKVLPSPELIESRGEMIFEEGVGIVRTKAKVRDRTYVYLQERGSGVSAQELAALNKMNIRALEAQLARDNRFEKDTVQKVWILTAWGIKTIGNMTALDAVELVLKSDGPMTQPELIRRAQGIYPKSYSRYVQVLESEKLGLNERGLWDLAVNGAKQVVPVEPKKKSFIRETESQKLIFEVAVTEDMLRGSGFPVDRRITWCAGLVQPTRARNFVMPEWEGKSLTLTRSPGNSSLSAIRTILESFGLKKKCTVQILLDLRQGRAYLRPHCSCHFARLAR